MNKQPEALRLADELEAGNCSLRTVMHPAAAELRRLHAENKALNDALQYSMSCHREMGELAVRQRIRLDELERLHPKRDPLTDEQIDGIIRALDPLWLDTPTGFEEDFCRAIERAHGIGGEA